MSTLWAIAGWITLIAIASHYSIVGGSLIAIGFYLWLEEKIKERD